VAHAAFGRAGASDVPEIPYTVTRLSSRVIVLDCLDVHVTAIAARSGLVVIDTNRSPGVMQRLRRVIEEEFGRQDFIDLFHTHGDPDHSSGNQVFPSVPRIAHQDSAAFILHGKASTLRSRWTRRSLLRRCANQIRGTGPPPRGESRAPPLDTSSSSNPSPAGAAVLVLPHNSATRPRNGYGPESAR
jgi:glyoxylase-like metal-dependent hydrolase (beta-lactamase superfamily II)